MRPLLITCIAFLPMQYLFAGIVTVQSKTYSLLADRLMHDHGHNALYQLPLEDVSQYLWEKQNIKRRSIKLISQGYLPGKMPLDLLRHFSCERDKVIQRMPAYNFFASLGDGKSHTYVLVDDVLVFTETADKTKKEHMKNLITKHFLLSKLQREVLFSGELHVYKNPENGEIFAVFDNSSGTYKPNGKLLPKLGQLLDKNFNSEDDAPEDHVFIVTKSYNQKIDTAKLFAHEAHPFQ